MPAARSRSTSASAVSSPTGTATPDTPDNTPATPFHDLDAFTALPRVAGLTLSPDGARLVTTVATRDAKGTGYATALWEVDPAGERQGGEAGGGDQPADEAATRLVVSAVEHIDRDHQHHAEENPREGGEDQ